MKEARAGYIPARLAADTLHSVFCEAVGKPPLAGTQQRAARNGAQARAEYAGILAWAIAQANAADLDDIQTRTNAKMPPGPAVTADDPDHREFWAARQVLQHVHDFARARVAAPWAVLGVVLVRAICTVQPNVKLPAIVGSRASLNLFLGLIGPSGSGKSIAKAVARDAINFGDRVIEDFPIGTGEGIAATYMRFEKQKDEPPKLAQHRFRALFHADEIDGVKAIAARNGATLLPVLRSAYSGETLGNQNADIHRRLPVARHSYRLGFIAGIQPARSAILLDDADGGTPQRFLWMPTIDPDAPDQTPPEPARKPIDIPPAMRGEEGPLEIAVCQPAVDLIRGTHLARIRGGNGDLLDGHGLLTQLKVATALGILDHRLTVTDEDWQLAKTVMAVSDRTRSALPNSASRQHQTNQRSPRTSRRTPTSHRRPRRRGRRGQTGSSADLAQAHPRVDQPQRTQEEDHRPRPAVPRRRHRSTPRSRADRTRADREPRPRRPPLPTHPEGVVNGIRTVATVAMATLPSRTLPMRVNPLSLSMQVRALQPLAEFQSFRWQGWPLATLATLSDPSAEEQVSVM